MTNKPNNRHQTIYTKGTIYTTPKQAKIIINIPTKITGQHTIKFNNKINKITPIIITPNNNKNQITSTINHQPSTINHQPSTINHQPSTNTTTPPQT